MLICQFILNLSLLGLMHGSKVNYRNWNPVSDYNITCFPQGKNFDCQADIMKSPKLGLCHLISMPCPLKFNCIPLDYGYRCAPSSTYFNRGFYFFEDAEGCRKAERHQFLPEKKCFKKATLIYDTRQVLSIQYDYKFLCEEIGNDPRIFIDFGDGETVKIEKRSDFTYIRRGLKDLRKYINYPISLFSTKFYICLFNHTYKKAGIYQLEIIAWNSIYKVMHTTFSIEVKENTGFIQNSIIPEHHFEPCENEELIYKVNYKIVNNSWLYLPSRDLSEIITIINNTKSFMEVTKCDLETQDCLQKIIVHLFGNFLTFDFIFNGYPESVILGLDMILSFEFDNPWWDSILFDAAYDIWRNFENYYRSDELKWYISDHLLSHFTGISSSLIGMFNRLHIDGNRYLTAEQAIDFHFTQDVTKRVFAFSDLYLKGTDLEKQLISTPRMELLLMKMNYKNLQKNQSEVRGLNFSFIFPTVPENPDTIFSVKILAMDSMLNSPEYPFTVISSYISPVTKCTNCKKPLIQYSFLVNEDVGFSEMDTIKPMTDVGLSIYKIMFPERAKFLIKSQPRLRLVTLPELPRKQHFCENFIHQQRTRNDVHIYYNSVKEKPYAYIGIESNQINRFLHNDTNHSESLSLRILAFECQVWNPTIRNWSNECNSSYTASNRRISCICPHHQLMTVHRPQVRMVPYTPVTFAIDPAEKNFIVILMLFLILVLFFGLYMSASSEDRTDQVRRSVCFLIDNHPTSSYSYLVIVHTGRGLAAGTTSNIGIMIEGTEATSIPHILRDWNKTLMEMGGQDWFVLKTRKPLGEIYCLHLWTDFSGVLPIWHCEKIVIHDIQTQQVWFFKVDKWFHPLHGDGTMAYTIYQMSDEVVFSKMELVQDVISNEFDCGMHGWFSIFFKHPYSNYTRKERVGVAFAHSMIILSCLVIVGHYVTDEGFASDDGDFSWRATDILNGFYAVLMAIPFHAFLTFIFRCTKPRPQITEAKLDWTSSLYSFLSYGMYEPSNYVPEAMPNLIPVSSTKEKAKHKKAVNFVEEVDRVSDVTLISRLSKERLRQAAGISQIVPFRGPGSNLEATSASVYDDLDLLVINDPLYGQEITEPSFCLPVWFSYISWSVLLVISAACLISTSIISTSYAWTRSLHFIASFILAILLSMFVVEPLKLAVFAFSIYFFTKPHISIEDRSDLVHALAPGYIVPKLMVDDVIAMIDSLRTEKMYTRLSNRMVSKLLNGKVCNATIKFLLADGILVFLLFLITMWILKDVSDYHMYETYENVDKLISGKSIYHTDVLSAVKNTDDFIGYLNNSLINGLHFSEDTTIQDNRTIDQANYLIGIVRLRQVRLTPRACRSGDNIFIRKCTDDYETRQFSDGWTENHAVEPKEPWIIFTPNVVFNPNSSRYPSKFYVAKLGRSKEQSLEKLQYLIDKDWFDWLTKAIFIDIVLFNPNTLHLSLVTLYGEYTDVLNVYKQIDVVKMGPLTSDSDLILLPLIFSLLTISEVFLYMKYRRYSNIKPLSFFSTRFYKNKTIVAILGLVSFIISFMKLVFVPRYWRLIADAPKSDYLDFSLMKYLNHTLEIILGLLIFLLLLDICVLLPFQATSVPYLTTKGTDYMMLWFVLMYLIVMTGFAMGLFFLLKNHFYIFNNCPFLSLITCSVRKLNTEFLNYQRFSLIWFLVLSFFAIFVVIILKWLMVVIVFHAYTDIEVETGKLRLVYTERFKEKYNLQFQSNMPNNVRIKAILAKSALDSKLRTIALLFTSFCYEQLHNMKLFAIYKLMAMDEISGEIIRSRHKNLQLDEEDYPNESELARTKMELAKAITRTIIITKALISKMNYMEARTDDIIRQRRHDILLALQKTRLKKDPHQK